MARYRIHLVISLSFAGAAAAFACGSDGSNASGEDGADSAPNEGGASGDGASDDGARGDGARGDGAGGDGAGSDGGTTPEGGDGSAPTDGKTILAAFGDHACAIRSPPGALECWGQDNGTRTTHKPGTAFRDVDVGAYGFMCAIAGSDGSIWCSGTFGGLVNVDKTRAYRRIAVGTSHQCAIDTMGALYCWGQNTKGELGVGDQAQRAAPTQVGIETDWKLVRAGTQATCAIKTNGTLWCWGTNAKGQLGPPAVLDAGVTVTRPAQTGLGGAVTTWQDVRTMLDATCAVRTDGALLCWGDSVMLGTTGATPTSVDNATDWSKVAIGFTHACATKTDGTVHCWGDNEWGQLGHAPLTGYGTWQKPPAQVGTATDWVDVAAATIQGGTGFSCATRTSGDVACWGMNTRGQLGQGPVHRTSPVPIGSPGEWKSVHAGADVNCGTRSNGELACWGSSVQLIHPEPRYKVPETVGVGTSWSNVDVGNLYALAWKSDGSLYAWGTGFQYELGIGAVYTAAAPTSVGIAVQSASAGSGSSCAIGLDGALHCWGQGIGGTPEKQGDDGWTQIVTGSNSRCGIKSDGTLWCWGNAWSSSPANVSADTTWTSLDEFGGTYWGVKGGTLQSWSAGNMSTKQQGTAMTWKTISAGSSKCGLWTDETARCFGSNSYGELGNGTTTSTTATSPVQVGAASDWKSITAGFYTACGIRGAGDLYCWGDNRQGQVGDGTAWSVTPLLVK